MHTLMVIAGGFALLAVCLLIGRAAGSRAGMAKAALVFLFLWFAGSALNLWVGVVKAGYTVRQELPVFVLVFGVPAAVALAVRWVKSER